MAGAHMDSGQGQWLENSREKGRKRRAIEYQMELKMLIEVFCRSVSSLTAHVKNKPCRLRHHINNEVVNYTSKKND